MVLPVGMTLQDGKYRIDEVLGNGGFGQTYKAKHLHLHQTIIVKTLNRSQCLPFNLQQRIQRFIAEARQLAQYQHPQIVPVMDLFVELDLPFVVTDYVPGLTLAQLVAQQPLPENIAIDYIHQVADVLATIHRTGRLHRVLTPDHLKIWDQTQTVTLTDFGLARQLLPEVTPINPKCLASGYAAIEQYLPQRPWTPATDIYALAATLYTLLTGQVPIPAGQRHKTPLSAPRHFQPQLSEGVERAVLWGMSMQPQQRPQSVTKWLTLLPEVTPQPKRYSSAAVGTTLRAAQTSDRPLNQSFPSNQSSPSIPKPAPQFPNRSKPSHFPKRALAWSALIAGVTGLGFGLLLRQHFTQQFASSPVPDQPLQPQFPQTSPQEELFLPKRPLTLGDPARPETEPSLLEPQPADIGPELDPPLTVNSSEATPFPAHIPTEPDLALPDPSALSDPQLSTPNIPAANPQRPRLNPLPEAQPDWSSSPPQPATPDVSVPPPEADPQGYPAEPAVAEFQ